MSKLNDDAPFMPRWDDIRHDATAFSRDPRVSYTLPDYSRPEDSREATEIADDHAGVHGLHVILEALETAMGVCGSLYANEDMHEDTRAAGAAIYRELVQLAGWIHARFVPEEE